VGLIRCIGDILLTGSGSANFFSTGCLNS